MRFAVIGSGSKGNAVLVQGGGATVLVDCGLTPKELRRRMATLDVELSDLSAIFVTHGHSDHSSGARKVAGACRLVTYATAPTHTFLARSGGLTNHAPIVAGEVVPVRGLRVEPFEVPHDAPGTVGFLLDDGDARLAICTDIGSPDPRVAAVMRGADTLYLEFNYDPDMLRDGPYPPALKRRVEGRLGHLANEDAASLLRQARSPGLRRVVLAHISEVNNTPNLALRAARPAVEGLDVDVGCAPQHHPTGWLRVGRPEGGSRVRRTLGSGRSLTREAPVVAAASARAATGVAVKRQLSLFGG